MFKKIVALGAAAALCVGLMSGCGAASTTATNGYSAENPLVLTLAHGLSETHTVHIAMTQFADEVAEKTDGRIQVKIFPNGQLGSENENLEQLQAGVIAMTKVSAPGLATYNEAFNAFGLPYIFNDTADFYNVMDSQEMQDFFLSTGDDGFVTLTYYTSGARSFYTKDKAIRTPADLKGLKIRGVSDWSNIETRLGASVVTMDGGDCYEALSRGTIDAAEYSSPSANWAAGFQEVAPYLTVPGVHQSCAVYLFLINRGVWESMDEQTQNIIKLACTAMMAQNWAEDRVANGQAWEQFKELEAQGKLTIYRMPDEDIAKIQQVADEYYAEKCQSNPLFAKIYESQQAYIQSVGNWSEAASY